MAGPLNHVHPALNHICPPPRLSSDIPLPLKSETWLHGDAVMPPPRARSVAPNGHPEMEQMVSVLAHEITEAITDPTSDGYFDDVSKDENADACNAYYAGVMTAVPPYYNVYAINGYKYLIQSNINPITNQCENGNEVFLALPPPSPPSPPPPPSQFCAAHRWGRRCFTCGHPFCICKFGSCRWWRG